MSVRCIYIVPSHYAQAISVDEEKDLLIISDQPHWQDYLPIKASFIHYIGNDHHVFEFARKVGALSLRWQPQVPLNIEVSGLHRIILHLALLAPLTLRCKDASFAEIHLTHGSELFQPIMLSSHYMPLIVLKTDKKTGRLPALPHLHGIKEMHIDIPWDRHHQMAFDCLQLLPFLTLETLIIKGPISMPKALTLLPLHELELHRIPDLSDFPPLSQFAKLEELTLCASETEGSLDLQQQARALPDLLVYYMSTIDKTQWEQNGYVYGYQADALDMPPANNHLGDSVLSIELEDLPEFEEQTAEDLQAQQIAEETKTLFERMRTESVTEFFRSNGNLKKESNDSNNEPSLFERMRTESVTEFFRNNKTEAETKSALETYDLDAAAEVEVLVEPEVETDAQASEQQSLLTRMRTESVTDFFRNSKRNK